MKIKFLFLALLLVSCGKETELKLPSHENRQVLSAFFFDEMDFLRLFISNSVSSTGSKESEGISDADVGLFHNNDKVLSFISEGDGFYSSPKGVLTFQVGEEYEIRSKVQGMPNISAKATLPAVVSLDSLFYSADLAKLIFKDPVGDDYYGFFRVSFYVRDSLVASTDYPSVGPIRTGATVSDETFEGQLVSVVMPIVNSIEKIGEPDTKVVARMVHVEKIWHLYEEAIGINEPDSDDFFGSYSTENVLSNVIGGYGFFGLGNEERIEKNF